MYSDLNYILSEVSEFYAGLTNSPMDQYCEDLDRKPAKVARIFREYAESRKDNVQ